MRLRTSSLKKFIDLPVTDSQELRHLLDDIGLEVKDIEEASTDPVYNIETLANRGDHVSVQGMARELSARFCIPLKQPELAKELGSAKSAHTVGNVNELCLRYGLLDLKFSGPLQLSSEVQTALPDADLDRHTIVHILNFVQLEMGLPMHAFDASKVEGAIQVVLSQSEEEIEALDGKTYKVPAESLLIKDNAKTIAVAGVIGCANSMVTAGCQHVLIEAACFDPVTVRKTARKMGLSTDASYAFERGADFKQIEQSLKRVKLLCSKATATVEDGGFQVLDNAVPAPRHLSLSIERVRRELNRKDLDEADIVKRYQFLGYELKQKQPGIYEVIVPSWRFWGVQSEASLIEDITRIISPNKVELQLPPLALQTWPAPPAHKLLSLLEPVLHGNGFKEIVTRSYYSNEERALVEKFDQSLSGRHLAIKNAIDSGYSHMKLTNLLQLAKLAEKNHRQAVQSIKIYEMGKLFASKGLTEDDGQFEKTFLTIAYAGRWQTGEWRKGESFEEAAQYFKGLIESLAARLGLNLHFSPGDQQLLHPGRQVELRLAGKTVGHFGAIHPGLKRQLDLSLELFYAQLDVAELIAAYQKGMLQEPVDFPAIRRDLTLKVGKRSFAGEVIEQIAGLAPEFHRATSIVDAFEKADEDFRRITYRLTFQNTERTLEHKEVDQIMQAVLQGLKSKYQLEIVT